MSQQSVQTVQAMWTTWRQGGFPDELSDDVAFYIASYHPEAAPGTGPTRGRKQVREMLARYWETVREAWLEVDELIDRGDRVVVRWRGGGIGRSSGLPFEWNNVHVCLVEGGKVTEIREYRDQAEALAHVEQLRSALEDCPFSGSSRRASWP